MRQLLSVVVASSLGGCSLVYNPSNLPTAPADGARPIDASIDAEVVRDADPTMLALAAVSPAQVLEGQGDGNSRPAMIVVEGMQIIPGAKITLTKHSDHSLFMGAVVDDANTVVSDDGFEVAAPVKFLVDTTQPAAAPNLRLDVTVTQMVGGTMYTKTISAADQADTPALVEKYLDEITDTPSLKVLQAGNKISSGTYVVSRVDIHNPSGAIGLTYADAAMPVIIRAVASIAIPGTVAVDAVGATAGPGGNSGGGGGGQVTLGTSTGVMGGGTGGGHPNGGGGGFGTKGSDGAGAGGGVIGEPELDTLSVSGSVDSSNGGAGGAGGTLSAGGAGGGGGGTIELTAGGDLTLMSVEATGGNGGATGSGNGGGGSGGAILLRAGHTLAVGGTVTVKGGMPGTNAQGTAAGAGGLGRIRVDSPIGSALGFQGPQFAAAPIVGTATLISRSARPMIQIHGDNAATVDYYFSDASGAHISDVMTTTIGLNGIAMFTIGADLFHGLNHFCITTAGGSPSSRPETTNCIDLVYLFKL